MKTTEHFEDPVEEAMSRRLAKLGGMPVDTSRLDAALRAQLPSAPQKRRAAWRLISAVAASLIVMFVAGFAMLQSRQVQASPAVMAQMHMDIVSGKVPTVKADSIDEANKLIAAMAGNFPKVPEPPMAHDMACCMKSVGNKQVACILLNDGKTPVTMAVADSHSFQPPHEGMVMRNGIMYHVQSSGSVNMVMTERGDRFVCLMSETPTDELMKLADSLKF